MIFSWVASSPPPTPGSRPCLALYLDRSLHGYRARIAIYKLFVAKNAFTSIYIFLWSIYRVTFWDKELLGKQKLFIPSYRLFLLFLSKYLLVYINHVILLSLVPPIFGKSCCPVQKDWFIILIEQHWSLYCIKLGCIQALWYIILILLYRRVSRVYVYNGNFQWSSSLNSHIYSHSVFYSIIIVFYPPLVCVLVYSQTCL